MLITQRVLGRSCVGSRTSNSFKFLIRYSKLSLSPNTLISNLMIPKTPPIAVSKMKTFKGTFPSKM